MNQTFYKTAIFFSVLIFLAGLIQGYFYFQIGARIYGLESYVYWVLLLSTISFMYHILLLKYFHYKNYHYPFLLLLTVTIASIAYTLVFLQILWSREEPTYYSISFLAVVGFGICYALSLFFTSNQRWLKIAAIISFSVDIVLFSTYAWTLQSPSSIGGFEKYLEWATFIGIVIPVFYLLNFWTELRFVDHEIKRNRLQNTINGVFGVVGAICLVIVLTLGAQMFSTVQWFAQQPKRAQLVAQPFDARIYVNREGDTLRYRLMKPLDYNPQEKYPIVVALHGGAGSGTDNASQVDGSWTAQILSEENNRENFPAFIFVPQCPPGSTWGAVENVPSVDELVFEAIAALEGEFAIDKSRRYVMGESLGGYGSWHFISTRPGMFAAAVPICGGGNPSLADRIVDVPVWAFHGAKDRIVPVDGSRKMIAAIKEAGGDPRYTEFAGEGHIISESFENTEGLWEWVFAQRLVGE
ncbi:carboxylesterase family protein [Lunatibacter salilacus]|uniref:carboxylesterase family protein n=1 Tax=Lunatibacter salilacus TaxID=2483804 RepID=UPI00131E2859|nr:dienelactone hydrolase family protein [Lunatibacter salilacus]